MADNKITLSRKGIDARYHDFIASFNSCGEEIKTMALAHSSYAHDHDIQSNERLEFLGDSVLGCVVSQFLYQHSKKGEGSLSKIKSALVCEQSLANHARAMHLQDNLLKGKSLTGKVVSEAMLCDLVEAMIGAIFLSFGYSAVEKPVLSMLDIGNFLLAGNDKGDFKTLLQELCQAEHKQPSYTHEELKQAGNQSVFVAHVFIDGKELSSGQGSTIKIAEKNAAQTAYNMLKKG